MDHPGFSAVVDQDLGRMGPVAKEAYFFVFGFSVRSRNFEVVDPIGLAAFRLSVVVLAHGPLLILLNIEQLFCFSVPDNALENRMIFGFIS